MSQTVYLLCAVASTACAIMLMRGYRQSRSNLLLWSSICFGLLALNNITLVVDVVLLPEIEFSGILWRNAMGAAAGMVMLFGLIWEIS